MFSRHDPTDSLADIIKYAERIERYTKGMDFAAFEEDEFTQDAIERCIERICEAVHRLGDKAEQLMPGHPWQDIRGMGNRLRHAYELIDLNVVWKVARERIPALAADARRALAQLEARSDTLGATPETASRETADLAERSKAAAYGSGVAAQVSKAQPPAATSETEA